MNVDLSGLRQSARVATILLAVMILLTALSAVTVFSDDPDQSNVRLVQSLDGAGMLLTGWAFITWLYRVRKNLTAAGVPGLRWHIGWTIGGWLIPVASLVIPPLVVYEIDRAVGPRRPTLFAWWAASWTITGLLYFVPTGQSGALLAVLTVSAVSCVTAAVCAILLVRRITANQVGAFKPHSPAVVAR